MDRIKHYTLLHKTIILGKRLASNHLFMDLQFFFQLNHAYSRTAQLKRVDVFTTNHINQGSDQVTDSINRKSSFDSRRGQRFSLHITFTAALRSN